MFILSSAAAVALAGSLVLGIPADPTPATPGTLPPATPPASPPTTPPTSPPTTPPTNPTKATVAVSPASVTTESTPLSVTFTCPSGTDTAWVTSNAFGKMPAKGNNEVGVRTLSGLSPGRYSVKLLCDGTTISATTWLQVVGQGGTPGPTPSGPPQTGGGSTAQPDRALYLTGLGLLGLSAVAGTLAWRRRRGGR
ncbi:hypothetical protein J4573_12650 [Actinomadura barringtoniae]|uniref:LPXTG cell wall anchor domain-containing protein n=1 Tax=Actinomadura barringtoniae TaxID=1427535 RepID=A0A939PG89_9ACTN|nr:hypothetical protein [Actinomadura barringtoniae]MBO2447946.1 hypothetical protein [Actinomadura barringtoniae]